MNSFDFEAEFNTTYFPVYRAIADIQNEHAASRGHRRLQLALELAEARLEDFCRRKMFTERDADYIDHYLTPKRILDRVRITALAELRQFEIENNITTP
jgi:hypothetical protein